MSDSSFGQILHRHGRIDGDAVAVSYGPDALSWETFEARTAAAARRLIAQGVRPDDFVAVALANGIEHHVASFGAWRAGATACILPTKLPGHELEQIIALAAPRILIRADGEAPEGIVQIAPGRDDAAIDLPPDLAASHWKAVTSGGSTGRPKLIVDHAETRFGARLAGIIDLVRMPYGGVMLNPGPLYHNAPFLFTSLALLAGTRVIGMTRFDPEEALRLIECERVEWVCMVPTMMHRIWNLPAEIRARYDLSSLRQVVHMAAACPAWLKQAWIDWLGPERILEIYAGTEGAAISITGEDWLRKPGSVGRAANGALEVRDTDGAACRPGEIGEIFFAAEAATQFHYLGDEKRLSEDGWLSLGDLGHLDGDGFLFLADRRTDLIIRGGANIYAAEVEAALSEHPDVDDVVVIGLPCDDLGQRVHAIVQMREPKAFAVDSLNVFVRGRLAGYKSPESYEITSDTLRDEAGKVRRMTLRDQRLEWLRAERFFRTAPVGAGVKPPFATP